MIPAPLYHPPPSTDRRRKLTPSSSASTTATTANKSSSSPPHRARTRPSFLRLLTTSEIGYAFLSLCLLVIVFIIISIIDANSSIPAFLNYPSRTAHLVPNATKIFVPRFSAAGSAKQLDALIHRIIAHSQHVNSSIPSTLIIAIAVNYAYRKLALNFVCNLHRLNISNYVVLAMDRTSFDYLSQRDVHVFFHDLRHEELHDPKRMFSSKIAPRSISRHASRHLQSLSSSTTASNSSAKSQDNEDIFGTSAFVETSRRKSLLVLRILSLGFSVLFSDVDVVWVTNPIPYMLQFSEHFVFQSDRSSKMSDAPPNYNINSGLYFARAAPQSIVALRAIIKYAYAIRRSEQKAFNYVLCGAFKDHHAGPGSRVGATQCVYSPSSATAKILPLDAFPNGSDDALWHPSKTFATDHPDIVAVHANYVSGREEKIIRMRNIGFWFQSDDARTRDECILPASP